MWRLIEEIVRSGLVTACRFASWPTSRSPVFVKATTEGVVRLPSAFAMTVGLPFHHGDDGIGGAEVDADDFCHGVLCVLSERPGPTFESARCGPLRPCRLRSLKEGVPGTEAPRW
jgi:hypothetical protein